MKSLNKNISDSNSKLRLLGIFIVASIIYLINNQTPSSGDTFPNSLLAFNFLENHTLNFDMFRVSRCPNGFESCYFFMDGLNKHLVSAYPVGSAIVSFPLYIVFYVILKIIYHGNPIDIASLEFEQHRVFFEKTASTIITSLSVVIYCTILELKFRKSVAWLSTLIFAFATNTWVNSSQNLWQSTVSNFTLVSIILLIFKANRTYGRAQTHYIVLASVACGLLPGIRSTSLSPAIAITVYLLIAHRKHWPVILLGLTSALPCLIWNWIHFGNFTGGYGLVFRDIPAYHFNAEHFYTAFLGTFFSSGRGMFIYSPILIYAIPGFLSFFKYRRGADEKLLFLLTVSSCLILISYCFYYVWWGGYSYGPRLTSETLPVLCILVSYHIEHIKLEHIKSTKIKVSHLLKKTLFVGSIVFSVFVQFVGAFSVDYLWDAIPLSSDIHRYRFWQVHDSKIERSSRSAFYRLFPSLKPKVDASYLKQASGEVINIVEKDEFTLKKFYSEPQRIASDIEFTSKNYNHLPNDLVVSPKHQKIIKIQVKNTGTVQWYGYKEGYPVGETVVRGCFYNDKNQMVGETRLYFTASVKPQDFGESIGEVTFPKENGDYRLVFSLFAEGVGEFPVSEPQNSATIVVHVLDQVKK